MDLAIDYTTGAGSAAVFARQRNFAGKYGNFSTGQWDTIESANTKVFFTEPDPINAPGFFSASFAPIPGGPFPVDIVEVSSGLVIGKADTDAPVNSIPTNPVLATDSRLNHLDGNISAIPTNPLLAPAYTAPDNAGIAATLTILQDTAHGLARLDTEIDAIAGGISTIPTLAEIKQGIIDDHGAGLYGPGVAAEFSIRVQTIVAGSVPPAPIPDVIVSLLNSDESVSLDQRSTDSMGRAVFPANSGNYRLRYRKAYYSFNIDDVVVAAADVVHVCAGTAHVIPAINIPGTQTLIVSAKELGIAWAAGDVVYATPIGQQALGGTILSSQAKKAVIGDDGLAEINGIDGIPVDIGAKIRVTVGTYYTSKIIVVDSTPVKNITEYV